MERILDEMIGDLETHGPLPLFPAGADQESLNPFICELNRVFSYHKEGIMKKLNWKILAASEFVAIECYLESIHYQMVYEDTVSYNELLGCSPTSSNLQVKPVTGFTKGMDVIVFPNFESPPTEKENPQLYAIYKRGVEWYSGQVRDLIGDYIQFKQSNPKLSKLTCYTYMPTSFHTRTSCNREYVRFAFNKYLSRHGLTLAGWCDKTGFQVIQMVTPSKTDTETKSFLEHVGSWITFGFYEHQKEDASEEELTGLTSEPPLSDDFEVVPKETVTTAESELRKRS